MSGAGKNRMYVLLGELIEMDAYRCGKIAAANGCTSSVGHNNQLVSGSEVT